jgi:tol-pal system protein YbgF
MQRYLILLFGLAVVAGPGHSQEYIDLEEERRQMERAAASNTAEPGSAPPAASQNQNFGELLYQIQLLQQEVMTLRGQLEEQGHQLRQLKQQSLERYVDLDRRISEGGAATDAGGTSAPTGGAAGGAAGAELPGEADAYRAAYSEVRSQQFSEAVSAFKQFLQDYPDGRYAPNAHYWLGELYLVISPQDLEASRQAFTLLLEQYPDNSKVPDALYKLGKVYYQKGNPEKARQFLNRVIDEHGSSNSPAVKLARDFLNENY